ncbi:hypothetical protein [Thermoflexus sp.]|uniref:hypothetical protein n=1 Tax=Thermoflexus sp. TaxID=1969742 RepID=UPI0035E456E1
MAFTVRDLEDLIRLLDRHPAWMEALRQRMLTKDLLESPKTLKRLSTRVGKVEKALQTLTESVAALTEAQRRHYEEFAAHRQEFLAYRVETEQRFAELREEIAAARAEADRRFAELAEAQRRHYEEFAAFRAETERRFAELREEVAAARAEADRRFAELAEAQRRHYEEFAAHRQEFLAYRVETEQRFAELREEIAAARAEADRRFAELAEEIQRLAEAQRRTQGEVGRLADAVGEHRGMFIEMRYRERPYAYFHRIVERPQRVEAVELEDLLEGHALEPPEEDRLRRTDLLLRGRREGRETWLAVEVSHGIGPGDVRRALRSAEVLRKLGIEALPVVAGVWLTAEAEAEARGRVWRVLDGRVYPPEAEAPTGPATDWEEDG